MTINHNPRSDTADRRRLACAGLVALAAIAFLALGGLLARDRYLTRGIPAGLPEPVPAGGARLGINVYLTGASEQDIATALDGVQATGAAYVKQTFYFSPQFDWRAADQIVEAAAARSLTFVPLLDGNPTDGFAPPADFTAYSNWAAQFAMRYGDRVDHYIIWDEPNLTSHWGGKPVNPDDYAALLTAAATAIRTHDANAVIVAAPLAPTTESGPRNLSETEFLRGLYQAGAADAFDVVALKPYGFDTGPEDRRVAADTLNFSRAVLVRELMESLGDSTTAVWAGNWGWNSLPDGWTGAPSIWGQTSAVWQAERTVAALERARREWPWMGVMFLENWQPGAPADDPRWGFSISGRPVAVALARDRATQTSDIAWPGFHPARRDGIGQQYTGSWEFSPEFGADIGQTGDSVTFVFWGTAVGARVRRADFRARLYATVDGAPANALPRDEYGTALVLTTPDPAEDFIATEWLARDLPAGRHVLALTASRGWDQWALNGFAVAYRPPEASTPGQRWALALLSAASALLAVVVGRQADWGTAAGNMALRFRHLSDGFQLGLVAALAAVVSLTGWLSWGPDALGLYRRLGDGGQLAATIGAAAVFYVTPAFILYAFALATLFGLLTLRPAWGLALIALTIPFYVPQATKPIGGYRFSPVEVFTLVTAAAWLARNALDVAALYGRTQARPRLPRLRRADWAVLLFLAVATLSLFFTARRDVAVTEWRVVIVEPALFYMLIRGIRPRPSELWIMLDAWVLSGVLVASYGLWQYATGQDLITAEGGLLRLRSIYGSPNNAALYLVRLLPFLAAMLLFGTRAVHGRRRAFYLLACLPVVPALLLTFSKGALLLGLPAGLLVIFWLWQRRAGRRTWPWALGAVAGGAVALLLAGRVPALAARLDLFGVTGVFRVNLWRSAVNMVAEHPVFGVGLDNFLYAYRGRYILDAAWQEPNLSHPHNILLDFATRLGLVGVAAGGWLIWQAVAALRAALERRSVEWLPVAAGLAGGLAAMLAHGLVDHSFFLVDLAYVFYLILSVGLALAETGSANDESPAP